MKKILLLILTGFCLTAAPVRAQTYTPYIWQYLSPQNLSGANDLQAKLDKEVTKVISAGHLAPFVTIYGKGDPQVDWYHAYDTVYTLSLTYPYVTAATQTAIKTYLQTEMASYPVWSATYLPGTTGWVRQPDNFADATTYASEIAGRYNDYAKRPKLFALYALWVYAQNTGDWAYINSHWSNITGFYTSYRSEVSSYYTSIAGAIGIARMAYEKTTPDVTTQNTAVADINTGMTNGSNFTNFGSTAEAAYQYIGTSGTWSYTENNFYMGWQFVDISPEIGRYFADNATLKGLVLGTSTSSLYSLNTGEYRSKFWYLAQAPYFGKVYGEDSEAPPILKAMIFPIHAWVLKDSAVTLRSYVDVPDALVGDYYFMQNLTRTIQAYGSECWENVQTPTAECPVVTGPSPTPAPVPVLGDFNGDGKVDYQDLLLFLPHFNELNPVFKLVTGTFVNIFDFNKLISGLGH